VDDISVEPLPDTLPLAAGALAEPLACVIHGMDNLGSVLGQDVLVYGGGPIGLMAMTLVARGGAKSVTVVEPNEARRAKASDFGATELAAPADFSSDDRRFHAVIDATGNEHAIEDGFSRVRSGGRFLILGVAARAARVSISPFEINWRELRIIGSMSVRHSFGRAAEMLGEGFLNADKLVTETLDLDALPSALESLGAGSQLKTLIRPSALVRR
jgi:2-desacetyl-2-hydroxyethyl bacteriochlorophyllide A dehydrogenase